MSLHQLLVRTYRGLQRFRVKCKSYLTAEQAAAMASYYPEKARKPFSRRWKENRAWALRYGEVNRFYTLYGFDVQDGPDPSHYIDYLQFRNSREAANRVGKDDSQVVLLRDKLLFFQRMEHYGFPVPEVFAFIRSGIVFDLDYHEIPQEALAGEKDYFLKAQGGECASFVKHIRDYEELCEVLSGLEKGAYILQRKVVQSAEMNRLNPHAINTLRIVTINRDGNCRVLSSLLRVGTAGSGNVDNWAAGGLAIGVRPNGYLKVYGFYKPGLGAKESIHPDTGVRFSDFKVPCYEEACDMACRAHKVFFNVRAIGWDVALTEDGPVFIEGNDNFEISLQQACDRPLKEEWLAAVADCHEEVL